MFVLLLCAAVYALGYGQSSHDIMKSCQNTKSFEVGNKLFECEEITK